MVVGRVVAAVGCRGEVLEDMGESEEGFAAGEGWSVCEG